MNRIFEPLSLCSTLQMTRCGDDQEPAWYSKLTKQLDWLSFFMVQLFGFFSKILDFHGHRSTSGKSEKDLNKCFGDPVKIFSGKGVFKSADRGLTGKRGVQSITGDFENRIMTQLIGVIGVFIPCSNLFDRHVVLTVAEGRV